MTESRKFAFLAVPLLAAALGSSPAGANYFMDVQGQSTPPFSDINWVFPNWLRVPAGAFVVRIADDTYTSGWCETSNLVGVTIYNYGTATGSAKGGGGDIDGMYFHFKCNATDSGLQTMTYAGQWTVDAKTYPAWTWAGVVSIINFPDQPSGGGSKGCGVPDTVDPREGAAGLYVYADIGPCPTENATVVVGPGFNDLRNPGCPGGVYEFAPAYGWGCSCGNWAAVREATTKTIKYILKYADREFVPPGDTITYRIYYGLAGTTPLTNVKVTDSLPGYTHYVGGGAVPPADPGADPEPGPPPRLLWTRPGGATTGGPTSEVSFKLTVDWGNCGALCVEPDSGSVGAPEGFSIANLAHVSYYGGNCPKGSTSDPTDTVVQRFLYWMIGDNDLLFSSRLGFPDDEMIYSIFIKNMSGTKQWWEVAIWDSVPVELDPWGPGFGFYDPCVGWTMTPSGCAAASPNKFLTGPKGETTLLTWRLDMPPGMTLDLQWKAKVRPSAAFGDMAINRIGLLEIGRMDVMGGTGHSQWPAGFTHVAKIMLPTTYISYVAYAGNDGKGAAGFFLDFFPLNKKSQFELRGIEYRGVAGGWEGVGGVSQSIGCLIGDCFSGFSGNAVCALGAGAISGGGIPGCKAERIPAVYEPAGWIGNDLPVPWHFIYKITSNAPVVWQMLTRINNCNQDRHTYAPASTLTYAGFMHYTWPSNYVTGDSFGMVNTGLDVYGNYLAGLETNVHVFYFEYLTNTWKYNDSYRIGTEAQAMKVLGAAAGGGATLPQYFAPWRIMSSDAVLVVNVGMYSLNTVGCCCCSGADNHGTFMPVRETGYVVAKPGETMYGYVNDTSCGGNNSLATVGNSGAAAAAFDLSIYTPNTLMGAGNIPPLLRGKRGSWTLKDPNVALPAGIDTAGNPVIYDNTGGPLVRSGSSLFRIKNRATSGANIQALHGADMHTGWAGGAVMHSSDANLIGSEFWLHTHEGRSACKSEELWAVSVFCPKQGMTARGQAGIMPGGGIGENSIYTTNGPDQCVAFASLSDCADESSRNWRFTIGGGSVITLYNMCKWGEKGFTAPFLVVGTHYDIITPPVVYVGQSYWLTVIVVDATGQTKEDYNGTAQFTSTDPGAKLPANYTYVPATDKGVKLFINVTMTTLGLQTIIATDTLDGSITGLAAVMVVGADIKIQKERKLVVAASGDTVSFRVCWSNYSSASGTNVVITDAIPMGTTYVPDDASVAFCGSNKTVVTGFAYSTSTSATAPTDFATITTGTPPASTRWLRWTVNMIGVRSTGCFCYRLRVD